jgi:hypothetical protein
LEGYEVWARLEGWFEAPEFVNGYRPDIVGRKGNDYLIIEIEKGEVDWPKVSALRQFQTNNPNVKLEVISVRQELRKTGT